MDYKKLEPKELDPPMSITHVVDLAGLSKMSGFLSKVKIVAIDTETNFTPDFWDRRVRTIQIGDKDEQYVIDLLAFAGSEKALIDSQGHYGKNNGDIYKPILEILDPVLCTNNFLKVGQNLSYEYEVLKWNLGLRIWNLFSTDLAERVIQAGAISLKKYHEFSMEEIVKRYFGLQIDKSLQKEFDLSSPLTEDQLMYAALDVRMPLAMRLAQLRILTRDQLLTTVQIENDAIGTFVDMHLNGQNMDDERWMKRVESVNLRRLEELKTLDGSFIPIVGLKTNAIDYVELNRLEKIWREDFESATPKELAKAAEIRTTTDKAKKAVLRIELKALQTTRAHEKAKARTAYTEKSKERTKRLGIIEKCEGEAFLNYGSNPQLLDALQHFKGMGLLTSVADEHLLKFNDRPIIQTLRSYRKGKKETGTYGETWVKRWVTKPLAKEGWRHPGDGRLHCLYNQLEAETGRSSSSKPNAQNLPHDEEVRSCFICDPPDADEPEGYKIVTVDLEGAELRIIAELAQAPSWLRAFEKGQDVHSVGCEILYPEKWPAAALPNCAYYEKDAAGELKRQKCKCPEHKKLRDTNKATNFLLAYGGGPDALADACGITTDIARETMKLHESKFPDIWKYLERSGKTAKENQEARSMFGRRRLLPKPTRETAIDWYADNEEENLELSDEVCERSIFAFTTKNMRKPTEAEKWMLTHRQPNEKEIRHAMFAMQGSMERKGKNHPIQSTNADIVKRAMGCGFDIDGKPYLWHVLPKFKAMVLSMVHDELVIQAPARFAKEVAEIIKDALRRAGAEVCKSVIMTAEANIENYWKK